jgi:hypothetical protein
MENHLQTGMKEDNSKQKSNVSKSTFEKEEIEEIADSYLQTFPLN